MKKIKNNTAGQLVLAGQTIEAGQYYIIQATEEAAFANNDGVIAAISNGNASMNDGTVDLSGINTQIDFLKDNLPKDVKITATVDPPPFATPSYRTKRDGTASWVTCPKNQATPIDFVLAEERYVTGGELLVGGAQQGDYVTAEIRDINSVIPEAYRAALCEAWPVVATYCLKKWLMPETGYQSFVIDTYPLNARITPGLSLRVTYYAADDNNADRTVAVNYHLTKKLI